MLLVLQGQVDLMAFQSDSICSRGGGEVDDEEEEEL